MLSGSAILRVAVLVVVAAVLATLVQVYWPYAGGEPATENRGASAVPVPSTPAPARPMPASPTPAPAEPPVPAPNPAPAPSLASPGPRSTQDQAFAPAPTPQPDPLPQPEPMAVPGQDAAAAADATGPRALSVLDLNSASLSELNRLQGGGAIGKAIIRSRPYSSVDQLLSKRVLSKSTYQRIKDQVTVR